MENNMDHRTIQISEEVLLRTYRRYPVVWERGEGAYLYDTEGRKYLDFAAGIAVCSLGYGHPEFVEALTEQMGMLTHTSNLFYSRPTARAAKHLAEATGMDRIFFTNSGTEAIEGACKAARKYAYTRKTGRYEIISMNHSFHGRSMGALSVTGTESYRTPFQPLIGGVQFAKFNNLDSVKALVNEKTCAILVEPVQGEGGIYPASKEFLKGIRQICDEQDLLLIFDEIQCGMGRTGELFAWQYYGVKPDIMTMAKGIGNGIPVGAFAMTEKVAETSLTYGDHGTTYGGNPLACVAVDKVLEIVEKEQLLEQVKKVSLYLEQQLDALLETYDCITERRGIGLMQGLVLTRPVGKVIENALQEGLVLIAAGGNVIRLVPPLIIQEPQVDEMIEKLKRALNAS